MISPAVALFDQHAIYRVVRGIGFPMCDRRPEDAAYVRSVNNSAPNFLSPFLFFTCAVVRRRMSTRSLPGRTGVVAKESTMAQNYEGVTFVVWLVYTSILSP